MTCPLEQMKADLTITKEMERTVLPASLVKVVERLKVGNSLLHALSGIEQHAWEVRFHVAEGRAGAFAISALQYGDLSRADYDALSNHIRERATARRALLKEKFDSQQPTPDSDSWYCMGRAAFNAGQPFGMCPRHLSEAALEWSKGWRAAQADKLTEGGY